MVPIVGGTWPQATIKHELDHQQLSEFVERAPRWLSEGLACYLETLRFSND